MTCDPIAYLGIESRQPEHDGVDDVAIGQLVPQVVTLQAKPNPERPQISLELVAALVRELSGLVQFSCHALHYAQNPWSRLACAFFQNSRILGLMSSRTPVVFSPNSSCILFYSVYEPERRQGGVMTTTFRQIEKENPFFPGFQISRILALIISRIPF